MIFFKKFLPILLVAIVFAVGGYFIGRGANAGQGASLYTASSKVDASRIATNTSTAAGFPVWLCNALGGWDETVSDAAGTHHWCHLDLLPTVGGTVGVSSSVFSSTCSGFGGSITKTSKGDNCALTSAKSAENVRSSLLKLSPTTVASIGSKGNTGASIANMNLFWCWLFGGNVYQDGDGAVIECVLSVTAKSPVSQTR